MKDAGLFLFGLGVVLAVSSLAIACLAPCSWFASAPLKDVPARCVGEMIGGGK